MTDLAPEREALVDLAAAIATRDPDQLESAISVALRDAAPVEAEEIILQAHLFVGFPISLHALARWRKWSGSPAPAALPEGEAEWEQRGPEVCARVYGGSYLRLRERVAELHPELDRWMVVGGYGRVLGRPGLDLATRELATSALLSVWDAPPQLHSHLRGALNAGAEETEVARAVEIGCSRANAGAAARARAEWASVRARIHQPA